MAIVYKHIRHDKNEVFYVGIGKSKHRAFKHGRNKHWENIVNKTDYTVELVLENISYEQAKQIEVVLISQYGRKDTVGGTLVNMTDGGDGTVGILFSDEHRTNLSKANSGENHVMYGKFGKNHPRYGHKHTDDWKEQMTGENNPFYGKTHSAKTIQQMCESRRDKKRGKYKLHQCPHCNKIGGGGAMKQYHFDNCKNKK